MYNTKVTRAGFGGSDLCAESVVPALGPLGPGFPLRKDPLVFMK